MNPTDRRSLRPALALFAALAAIAVLVGVVAAGRYRKTEARLATHVHQASVEGRRLGAEQCVDHVVRWARHCDVIHGLCEWSAARMMQACLVARDRRGYCSGLDKQGLSSADTRFGYGACRARQATGGLPKRTCAVAYRIIDRHCRYLSRHPLPAKRAAATPAAGGHS